MKRFLSFTLALLCTLWLGAECVLANNYDVDDTDVNITVDSEEWSVFTRENVLGNSELKGMGISPQYLYNSMINTDTYLHMFRTNQNERETIEFKIIKHNTTDINNYKNISDKKLKKTGEQLAATKDADAWKLYSNDSKYIYFEYKTTEHNIVEYYTIVNQEIYRLMAFKPNKFSETEKAMIEDVVDNVQYTINPLYANEKNGVAKYWSEYGTQTVVIIIIAIVIAAVVVVYKKRKAIKDFITGKRNPNKEMKKELKETRYVNTTPKATQKPISKPVKKKPADSSMVTIDRQKRNARKK